MAAFRRFVSKYQLLLFVLLASALSWSIVIPTDGLLLPHGPALAAVIVLAIVAGRRGLSDLWRPCSHWCVRWICTLSLPGSAIMLPLFTGPDQARYYGLFIAMARAIALILIPRLCSRSGATTGQAWAAAR